METCSQTQCLFPRSVITCINTSASLEGQVQVTLSPETLYVFLLQRVGKCCASNTSQVILGKDFPSKHGVRLVAFLYLEIPHVVSDPCNILPWARNPSLSQCQQEAVI